MPSLLAPTEYDAGESTVTNEELADKVVSILSAYLVRRRQVGTTAINFELDVLQSLIEARLTDLYDAETFARFLNAPGDITEIRTLRARLERILNDDNSFRQEVITAIGNPDMTVPSSPQKNGRRTAIISLGAVIVLIVFFLIGRSTTSNNAPPMAGGTTTPIPSESSSLPTTDYDPGPSSEPSTPNNPGDGSSLAADTPVFLVDLPVPNDNWTYQYGSHDVQLTQYQYAVWTTVDTCSSGYLSREQQFRLKSFKRLAVKAVGTDSTSDPALAVKFEVFINNNKVNPIASVVANPGESKPIDVTLPANVFSLTLRSSVDTVDKSVCHEGNAVWGYPYVTAAGS